MARGRAVDRGPTRLIMRLTLVEPSLECAEEFLSFLAELRAEGTPLAGTAGVDRQTIDDYVGQLCRLQAGEGLESWQVPMSTFWLVDDDRCLLGISRLRHRLTPSLRTEGGHIGYQVRPSARRLGVGTQLLTLTLAKARALGLDRVLLSCDFDNLGSRRVIENNGGQLEVETVSPVSGRKIRRYWIDVR